MLTRLIVRRASTAGIVLALVAFCLTTSAHAQNDGRNALVFRATGKNSQLTLTEKEARLLELPDRIKTVDGFDPAIVKITTVDNFHQVRVLALAPGFTQVVLVDEHGLSYTVDVLVNGDVKQFQALIRQAAPGSAVQAIKVKDAVMLLGWVDQAGQATKIVELAEMHFSKVLNYLQVSGVQTIMLRVRMMEAQRSKIRQLGFNFVDTFGKSGSAIASFPGALVPFATPSGASSSATSGAATTFSGLGALGSMASTGNPSAATGMFSAVSSNNALLGFIEALRQENLLTILAEPNLTTTNGRPANFLDGGQFPVPVPQGLGTVSIQYKKFGVQLEFVPTILSSGRLRMQVSPSVSSKDFSNSVIVQGINVPSLITREVNTEVEMNFGETLIIGGLISNQVTATTSKIPFLGELPWIGAAFRRVLHNEAETELIVMVTPELVSPVDESQLPDGPGRGTVSPTDRELFFNGYVETPRYAPDPAPPTTNFGFSPGYASPPTVTPPPGGMMPRPAYETDGMRHPAPGTEIAPPAPAPGPAQPVAPAPTPNPPGEDGEGASAADDAGAGKAPQSSAVFPTRKSAASRRLATSGKAVRPVKPTRTTNPPGPIVPASGIKPAGNRPADPAGDADRPGLIAP